MARSGGGGRRSAPGREPRPAVPRPAVPPRATRPAFSRPAFFLVAVAVLLLGCLAAYGGSLGYGFVSDDLHLIVERLASYRESFPIREAFAGSFWKGGGYGALPGEEKDYYRPLVTLSYALDARIGGGEPRAFHLTNVLLHAAASALVLLLLLRLRMGRWVALAGSLLFALHPIHVANVSWIAGRTDLLCAVFLLLAYERIAASIDGRVPQGESGAVRLGALGTGLAAYLLALLAKEMAVTLAGLAALHVILRKAEAHREGRSAPRSPWLEVWAIVGVTILYGVFRAVVLGLPDFSAGARSPSVGFRPGAFPAILPYYWGILVVAPPLRLEADFAPIASALDPRVLLGLAVLAVQLAATIGLLRRGRTSGLGLGWMLVSLLPVSHMVPLVFRAIVAEYWAYLPSVGFVIALASAIPWALDRARSFGRERSGTTQRIEDATGGRAWGAVFVLAGLAIAGGSLVPARSSPLRSEETHLWHQVRLDPDRVEAWVSLAAEYGERREIDRALACIREAVARRSDARGVQLNLGHLFDLRGLPDSAEAAYRRELRSHPASDEARVSLADVLLRRGADDEAARLYREAIEQGGVSVADMVSRARRLREAAVELRAQVPWERRAEALGLASGIYASIEAAGAPLDPVSRREWVDAELRLGRFDRASRAAARADRSAVAGDPLLRIAPLLADSTTGIAAAVPRQVGDREALEALRSLADFYHATGRTALALPVWRVLLRGGSLTDVALNEIALIALRGSPSRPASPSDAERIWSMLLEEEPDHPLALLNLGWIAFTAGDRARAGALWRRFLERHPDHPRAAEVRSKLEGL